MQAYLLIAVGAILRFGISTVSTHGVAIHTIGDILMIVGVLGVVLWLVVWAPWSRSRRPAYRRPGASEEPVYREEPATAAPLPRGAGRSTASRRSRPTRYRRTGTRRDTAAELASLRQVSGNARLARGGARDQAGLRLGRVSFNVSADAYLRFMGQYSEPLAAQFADLAGSADGQRVLDVGCGPGALTAELVNRAGADAVSAVEPSASFAAAVRERLPGVDVRQSAAEQLPFPDAAFDAAMAQLVVHFMADPVTGLREMGRVTRPGGVVAACVWDHAGGRGPLSAFWRAVRELDPGRRRRVGPGRCPRRPPGRALRAGRAGRVQVTTLTVHVRQAGFESWWETFTLGVGPAGAYLASLDADRRAALREQCRRQLPAGPFEVSATAWAATATSYLDNAARGT